MIQDNRSRLFFAREVVIVHHSKRHLCLYVLLCCNLVGRRVPLRSRVVKWTFRSKPRPPGSFLLVVTFAFGELIFSSCTTRSTDRVWLLIGRILRFHYPILYRSELQRRSSGGRISPRISLLPCTVTHFLFEKHSVREHFPRPYDWLERRPYESQI